MAHSFKTSPVKVKSTNRLRPKLFFCGLYFVQGAILAYVSNFQKPYLSQSGISVNAIAMLTSAMIAPFIAKIFFGVLSDRFSFFGLGHRRPYMLMGLALSAICFLILAKTDPHVDFPLFFALMVTATFGMALFDTCADGFAIDVNREIMSESSGQDESASIQSFMMSGKALGYILLSGVFGWVVGQSGYGAVFAALSSIIAFVFCWVLFFAKEKTAGNKSENETTTKKSRSASEKTGVRAFFTSMGRPALFFAFYAVVYSIFSFGIDGIITLFLNKEIGLPPEIIGAYGSARGVGAVIGAVLSGWCATKFGARKAAYAAIAFLAVAMLALLEVSDKSMALVIGVFWGAAWGFQETVFVTLAMRIAEQRLAATAFALLMIFSNFGTAIGEGLATSLSGAIGFKPLFASFAAANLLVLPLLWLVFKATPKLGRKL